MRDADSILEGRNVVLEAIRADRSIEKLFLPEGKLDGSLQTVAREAKKRNISIEFVNRSRLDSMSQTRKSQGVIAYTAAWEYSTVETILEKAREKGEPPFVFVLDGITDPHNLGAIIRTANIVGASGVIIKKHGAVGLTATVAKASAGALLHTPVARVSNLRQTIESLQKEGLWFVCADPEGEPMYSIDLKGSIGIVIGDEGSGVSDLVKKTCDYVASIPMYGNISSLNASVACGVLAYEVVRQRIG